MYWCICVSTANCSSTSALLFLYNKKKENKKSKHKIKTSSIASTFWREKKASFVTQSSTHNVHSTLLSPTALKRMLLTSFPVMRNAMTNDETMELVSDCCRCSAWWLICLGGTPEYQWTTKPHTNQRECKRLCGDRKDQILPFTQNAEDCM